MKTSAAPVTTSEQLTTPVASAAAAVNGLAALDELHTLAAPLTAVLAPAEQVDKELKLLTIQFWIAFSPSGTSAKNF
jgi:hypothetical protein